MIEKGCQRAPIIAALIYPVQSEVLEMKEHPALIKD